MTKAYVIVHEILTYRNRQKHNRTCKPRMIVYSNSTIKQYNSMGLLHKIKETTHDERSLVKIFGT